MKFKLLFLLVIPMLFFGCKKDKNDLNVNGEWNLKSYSVIYYNQAGDKVYESKPDELLQFSKIEINNDSIAVFQEVKSTTSQSPIKTNPASLVFLNVKKSGNAVSVNFGTASELNAGHWIIYRSGNGILFHSIATINAQGNSNAVSNYSFIDASPLFGLNYYGLTQVDLDGRITQMGIRLILMNFSLSRVNGNISLPVDLIDHTFKQVAITFPGRRMIWNSEAENPQYTENGVTKTAASATLVMTFDK